MSSIKSGTQLATDVIDIKAEKSELFNHLRDT